ncbi:hypothetical protein GCM10023160_30550 [Brachybacterium paraconglomeratum]|uniref:hypothetical protein n=1 Tax=Brachybacterium paraconglomeratum TaxID=173362 RepID=UPI0031EECFF5
MLTTAITKGLQQLRQHWIPPGERPDPVVDEAAASDQDVQRHRRRARTAFFQEVDERDARPGVRRALIAWTVTLWGLNLVVGGWILLWILGAWGIDLLGIVGRSAELPPLWSGPTMLVLLAVVPLSWLTAWFSPIDQIELQQPRRRTVADATRARRARVWAARWGEVITSLLIPLPLLVVFLIDPKDTFPWAGFGSWRNEAGDLGWWAVWALALPWVAMVGGVISGGPRGSARAKTLWPEPEPEPEPDSETVREPEQGRGPTII